MASIEDVFVHSVPARWQDVTLIQSVEQTDISVQLLWFEISRGFFQSLQTRCLGEVTSNYATTAILHIFCCSLLLTVPLFDSLYSKQYSTQCVKQIIKKNV